MDELYKLLDGKSPNDVAEITKACMQYLLKISIAKATIARVYPEAEQIVNELEPNLLSMGKQMKSAMLAAPIGLQYGA